MPKVSNAPQEPRQARRHNPLAEEYAPTNPLKQKAGKKRKVAQVESNEEGYVGNKASQRILKIGQELVEEDERDQKQAQPNPAFAFDSREAAADGAEDEVVFDDDDDAWGDEEDEVIEEAEADVNDQDIFNRFHPDAKDPDMDPSNLFKSAEDRDNGQEQGINLADLILEKIAAHEAAQAGPSLELEADEPQLDGEEELELPPKVKEVYMTIGQLLSRQKSGPLPKPFKVLPTLPAEQIPAIIALTSPDSWSPYVHLMSTRLFISAKPQLAQPYLTSILLPRIRADIHETRKLHVHLYAALKKALYKPACFFKGLLFPLLEEGDCTLREAHIISSVITRVSVPVLHSAAALLRLCDIAAAQFSARSRDGGGAGGSTSVFIRCLLDKKYALPYKVVDALVFYFLRFKAIDVEGDENMVDAETKNESPLPVLWHQCFLSFAQRYRNDVTEDQREALLDVLLAKGHKSIGPEIRRELLAGRGRGVMTEPSVDQDTTMGDGGDDTMFAVT